ncbi:uncharacterized protein DDB_G0285291-like [Prorops nasuta]|uniref:uncharacterized protein DDB_G0285291-like n=1 Tax=Prorops nasuta TaxID=863751 RepID=UPI0034CD60BB
MKFLVFILAVSPIYAFRVDHEYFFTPITDHLRERRAAQHYRPVSQAPAQIQQLLQSQQARDPIVHLPPQPPPQLTGGQRADPRQTTQAQFAAYRPQVQYGNAPQQPTYQGITPKVVPLQGGQPAAQHGFQQAPQAQQAQPNYRALYRPISAPQAAPQYQQQQQPQYSSKLPAHLQQLVQLQAQLGNPPQHSIPIPKQ